MAKRSAEFILSKLRTNSAVLITVGTILIPFPALCLYFSLSVYLECTSFSEFFAAFFVSFLFASPIILGIYLIRKGLHKKQIVKNYYAYSIRINADPKRSLDRLATSLGQSVAMVHRNISEMVVLGLFPDCYIDIEENRLVTPQMSDTDTAPQTVAIECDNCGASNCVIVGVTTECEFCGTQLSASIDKTK